MTDATIDVTLNVTGMKCGGCENNIEGKLSDIEGVLSVDANSKEGRVSVEFIEANTNLDQIKEIISEAGFTVEDSE